MVPKRLREARLKRGLKQTDLAVLLDFEGFDVRKTLSNYETGRHSPPFSVVTAIAKALEYPECYFYIWDDIFAAKVLALFEGNPPDTVTAQADELKNLKRDILSLAKHASTILKNY